jgi:hypothetical protein
MLILSEIDRLWTGLKHWGPVIGQGLWTMPQPHGPRESPGGVGVGQAPGTRAKGSARPGRGPHPHTISPESGHL